MSRIDALLADMTLAEKLGQLTMTASGYAETGPIIVGDSSEAIIAGEIGNLLNIFGPAATREVQRLAVEKSRLSIPLLIGLDVLHGHRTLFPIPLAEAALFDPETWRSTARESAREASADGIALTFAPMLDVSRDMRWGRMAESPGEDPWLAARFAQAKVQGFQGEDLAAGDSLAACAKHFCAYGAVNAGRDYASVDISARTLGEVHLPPFAAAVAAGVATIMPAFTDLAGVPMTAHIGLLRHTLRDQLGFEGVIVSDYHAIAELVRHGVAADLPEAAALALTAGVDIDMMAGAYRHGLPIALERGLVSARQIDASVRRVLKLKERLGLFDDPYRSRASPETAASLAQRRELARSVAARAIVMLKNDRETLPLTMALGRLCVLGPLADAAPEMGGPWAAAAQPASHVSVLAGLRAGFPATEIVHAPGVGIGNANDEMIDVTSRAGIAAALELCHGAEAIVLCLGEAAAMSGEAASRAYPGLPGQQRALAEAVLERAHSLQIPVIAILFSGRPLLVSWLAARADALLAAWFLGSEAGHALADVLSGRVSPSGRTPICWPRALGQVPIFFGARVGGRPADAHDRFTSKYLDVPNEPLYPFGHGLTYSHCTLANLRVEPATATEHDTIAVRVDATNEGTRTVRETVFLFTHDVLASVARPPLELKGYVQADLRAGEAQTLELSLPAAALRFLGADLRPVFEPGVIEILVGPCADRARLLVSEIQLRT
jgi:beta-glucosidase